MTKKINFILTIFIFCIFLTTVVNGNIQTNLLNKYKNVNTLYFDFTQKIGNKIELGSCHIKYPLLMKCEYPKKNKTIISNGKQFAIIKKRYKKIYYYPLNKTPLFYLLNKKNILDLIKNYKPKIINAKIIEYELKDNNSITLNIFFDKNSLNLAGWKTIDSYSNEVNFIIKNVKPNIIIENEIFKIPQKEDL